jgi:hypothetical protein
VAIEPTYAVNATPGNYFGAWGNAVMSTNNPLFFTEANANPTVSCVFGALSVGQAALTVVVNGGGRVVTNPRGSRFNRNQAVTLSATPDSDQVCSEKPRMEPPPAMACHGESSSA